MVTTHQTRAERQEIPLGAGGLQDSRVSMPIRSKMIASSFINAMLRSRWVFSITLAASATLIEDAG